MSSKSSEEFPPVKKVKIENFKSIKHIELECGRVNVFIGEPNSGKSNILEAVVGLPSSIAFESKLQDTVRFERLSNLFYDEIVEEKILIDFGKYKIIATISTNRSKEYLRLYVDCARYYVFSKHYYFTQLKKEENWNWSSRDYFNSNMYENTNNRFKRLDRYPNKLTEFLMPPSGDNLVSILTKNKKLRKVVNDIISKFGFKFIVKPREDKIEIQKELEEGVVVSFPYTVISDTIQRLIFYISAILTNKNSVIAMEEPEAHAFPFYTKHLAELIALDETNQYFISTYNPYFLLTLIEKTPKKDLAVYVTYYEDYQTKVKKMSEKKIQEILDLGSSVFFNLDILLED